MDNSKIEELINNMTIEEKLAQMTQLSPVFFGVEPDIDLTGPMEELNISPADLPNIGSTLNYFGAEKLIHLQKSSSG